MIVLYFHFLHRVYFVLTMRIRCTFTAFQRTQSLVGAALIFVDVRNQINDLFSFIFVNSKCSACYFNTQTYDLGPSCKLALSSRLTFGYTPLMFFNGNLSCQTQSGKVRVTCSWNNCTAWQDFHLVNLLLLASVFVCDLEHLLYLLILIL